MSNNCQTLEVATDNASENVGIIEPSLAKLRINHVEFDVTGVGSGYFTYIQNYDYTENNFPACFPLESVVWNGKAIDLTGFTEQSICFDLGKLMGLNLLGEGWEIICNLAINIDSVKIVAEVTYQEVATPTYVNQVRELVNS